MATDNLSLHFRHSIRNYFKSSIWNQIKIKELKYVINYNISFLNRKKKSNMNHACHLKTAKSCPLPLQISQLVESIYSTPISPQHLMRTSFTALKLLLYEGILASPVKGPVVRVNVRSWCYDICYMLALWGNLLATHRAERPPPTSLPSRRHSTLCTTWRGGGGGH